VLLKLRVFYRIALDDGQAMTEGSLPILQKDLLYVRSADGSQLRIFQIDLYRDDTDEDILLMMQMKERTSQQKE
jgi:hypothetical protein